MSKDNAENAIRRCSGALNRMDPDAVMDVIDPEIEWRTELIGTPVYRGHDGVRQALHDIQRAWDGWRTEVIEIEAGERAAFLGTRAAARARATGIEVEAELFYAVFFRDGKVIRVEGFTDREAALAAAGLE